MYIINNGWIGTGKLASPVMPLKAARRQKRSYFPPGLTNFPGAKTQGLTFEVVDEVGVRRPRGPPSHGEGHGLQEE